MGLFFPLPLICLFFMDTEQCKEDTFSWCILMHPPQGTNLVVKTQGEREFQVPVWNRRGQLFSACKGLEG